MPITTISTLTLKVGDILDAHCQSTRGAVVDASTSTVAETFCGKVTSVSPAWNLEIGLYQDWSEDTDSLCQALHASYMDSIKSPPGPLADFEFEEEIGGVFRSGTARMTGDVAFGGDAGGPLQADVVAAINGVPDEAALTP